MACVWWYKMRGRCRRRGLSPDLSVSKIYCSKNKGTLFFDLSSKYQKYPHNKNWTLFLKVFKIHGSWQTQFFQKKLNNTKIVDFTKYNVKNWQFWEILKFMTNFILQMFSNTKNVNFVNLFESSLNCKTLRKKAKILTHFHNM